MVQINRRRAGIVQHEGADTRRIIDADTDFVVNEAYKSARTNIMFSVSGDGEKCKQMVITSALSGEGKSTISINLGIVFAQTDRKVILIDADLRKPKMHKYLQVSNKIGLSNYLGGFAALDECVRRSEEHHMDYITAGHVPPNPIELLSGASMQNLLKELAQHYDYVIIDTPPTTIVSDAAIVAKMVGKAVMVVRENFTNSQALKQAVKGMEFAGVQILGFVLTGSREKRRFGKYRLYGKYKEYGRAHLQTYFEGGEENDRR